MTHARVLTVATVLLATALAGCALAPAEAAVVPQDALDERNWASQPSQDLSALQGAVSVFVREYAPEDKFLGIKVPGGVHLATAPDVPVVDEAQFAEDQIVRLVRAQGIELGDRERENFELADGRVVSSSVYTIQQNEGTGKLRVVPFSCTDAKSFVLGVGWGAEGAPFTDASALLGAVECPS